MKAGATRASLGVGADMTRAENAMDQILNEPSGFQQTQTTRVKDPGPAQNANPPPPPKAVPVTLNDNDPPSPHPNRGQTVNTVV